MKKQAVGDAAGLASLNLMPSSVCGSDFLISSSRDKTIRVWEVSTGYTVTTLNGHEDWVRKARPSPNGHLVASVGNDHTVRIWSYSSGDVKFDLREHNHVVECISWAPDAVLAAIRVLTGADNGEDGPVGPFFATVKYSCHHFASSM